MPHLVSGGTAFRIRAGEYVGFVILALISGLTFGMLARVIYDDGTWDILQIPQTAIALEGNTSATCGPYRAQKDGSIVAITLQGPGNAAAPPGSVYVQAFICSDESATPANIVEMLAQGYVGPNESIQLGQFIPIDFRATWVFQGTIAEDATAGTHLCTLTVAAGTGSAFFLQYGMIIPGNTATSQTMSVAVDDGTNLLAWLYPPIAVTVANQDATFPSTSVISATNTALASPDAIPWIVSGSMRLILKVSTAAVSVTQTFSLVCRVRGQPPEGTLADSVGTPTLTTNTDAVL